VVTFRERHCAHCLKKVMSNGETLYYHPVLEAKLVTRNGFAFSLMTEFIENQDLSADKQDCELKAFYRLAVRIKQRFPRLPICLLMDGLYAGGPTFEVCKNNGWKYLIVLCEDDLVNLHRSYAAVLPHLPQNHKQICLGEHAQTIQDYHWAEDLAYCDDRKHIHSLNLIEFSEKQPDAQRQISSLHYKWITNFTLTFHNVDLLAQSGRSFQHPEEQRTQPRTCLQQKPQCQQGLLPAAPTGLHHFSTDGKKQPAPGCFPQRMEFRQAPGLPPARSLAQSRHLF